MRRNGFTLIELLVVVAIIIALLAILLPSMGRALETANLAVCSSNERQCITSALSYGADSFGALPPLAYDYNTVFFGPGSGYIVGMGTGAGRQYPNLGTVWQLGYLGDANVLYCPSQQMSIFTYENYASTTGGEWGVSGGATGGGTHVRSAYMFNQTRVEKGSATNAFTPRYRKIVDYESEDVIMTDVIINPPAYGPSIAHGGMNSIVTGYADNSTVIRTSPEAIQRWIDGPGYPGADWPAFEAILELFGAR